MNEVKLGELITNDRHRDAIHVAVAPVVAGEDLFPGDRVRVENDIAHKPVSPLAPIGIVDPFLNAKVKEGQRFWVCLLPGTITSLRHEWTHPQFQGQNEKSASEQWLREFAEEVGVSYKMLMEAIDARLESDWDYHVLSYDTPDVCSQKLREMWDHYENITGKRVKDKTMQVFTCSC